MSEESLRMKKKLATRQALSEAAFQLARERGLNNIVVEDIVNRAGYSRRTFANHYSCKEEAIANALPPIHVPGSEDDDLEGLTPLSAIELKIKHTFSIHIMKRLHELISLSRSYPTLKLYVTAVLKEIQDDTRKRISEAFGTAYSEEYYHILIGSVFGALIPVLEETIKVKLPLNESDDESNQPFDEYIHKVFSSLREGFK